jgi:hypothetical protein
VRLQGRRISGVPPVEALNVAFGVWIGNDFAAGDRVRSNRLPAGRHFGLLTLGD